MNYLLCKKVFPLFNKKEKWLKWSTICAKTSFIIAFALLSLNTTYAAKKAKRKKEKKTTKLSINPQWVYRAAGIGAALVVAHKGISFKSAENTAPTNKEIEIPVIVEKQPIIQNYIQPTPPSSQKSPSKSSRKKKRKKKHHRRNEHIDDTIDISSFQEEKTDQQEQNGIEQELPIANIFSASEAETDIQNSPPPANNPSKALPAIKDTAISEKNIRKDQLLEEAHTLYKEAIQKQENGDEKAKKDFKKAKHKFKEALKYVEDENGVRAAEIHYFLGLCYLQQNVRNQGKKDKKAIESFKKAQNIYKEKKPNSIELGKILYYLANGYDRRKEYKEAIKTIDEAINVYVHARKNKDTSEVADLLRLKATIYYQEKNYEESLKAAKEAEEIHEKIEEAIKNNQNEKNKIKSISAEEKAEVTLLIANSLNRMAKSLDEDEKRPKILEAVEYYKKASAFYKKAGKEQRNQDLEKRIEGLKKYYPEEFNKPEPV